VVGYSRWLIARQVVKPCNIFDSFASDLGTLSQLSRGEGAQIVASLQERKSKERGGFLMRVLKVANSMLLGLAVLLGTTTWAGGKDSSNKGALKVANPISVNGTRLTVGDYQVKWEGAGPNVELNIVQSNRIVATVPARLVDLSDPRDSAAYETRIEENGSMSLTAIYFAHKHYEIEIGQASTTNESMKDGNPQ
jgi:hypothetical protein